METFLGRQSFAGHCADVTGFSGTFAGQADFNGCIAFCHWSREEAAAALPAELELADNTSPIPTLHPVAFVFGEQTAGATIFGGITFPLGVSYHEFALAIPFVRHRRGRNLHTFMARMYSSYFPATWAGNAHYGLAKEMASMWWEGAVFVVGAAHGATRFRGCVEPAGEWGAGPRCQLPNFAAVRDVFALPVVGRRSDGTFVTSYFGWDFAPARVRAARATLAIDTALADGVTPRSCRSLADGTFEVRRMIWRLSWPAACRF
jgi:hypothetical protein